MKTHSGTTDVGSSIPRVRNRLGAIVLVAGLALLTCCSNTRSNERPAKLELGAGPPVDYIADAPKQGEPPAKLTLVGSFESTITGVSGVPHASELLISTRSGSVYKAEIKDKNGYTVVKAGGKLIDLTDEILTDGERGLLNVQVLPDGKRLVVVFTAKDGAIKLRTYRYSRSGAKPVGDVLSIPHPFSGHNGGGLAISDDGAVYLSLGDMAVRTDPLSQQLDNPYGKIISIPLEALEKGKPIQMDDPQVRTVAIGLRNPWRISVDSDRNELWIGDVGEHAIEELNVLKIGDSSPSPANFGWPYYEGTTQFDNAAPPDFVAHAPELMIKHGKGACSITGGLKYRGKLIPSLSGKYIFGDLCGDVIKSIDPASIDSGQDSVKVGVVATAKEGVTTFGEASNGEVFVGDLQGGLYRLDPVSWKGKPIETPNSMPSPEPTVFDQMPSAVCAIPTLMGRLAAVPNLDPARAKATLLDAIDQIEKAGALAPVELRTYIQDVANGLRQIAGIAEASGWELSQSELSELAQAIGTGKGQWANFAFATQQVGNAVEAACP